MSDPSSLFQIRLSRPDSSISWGFRLEGGSDLPTPLCISKVNPGSLAERAGLQPDDVVLQINYVDVTQVTHEAAKMEIIRGANNVDFTVQRGGPTIWRPRVTPIEDSSSHQQPVPTYGNSNVGMVTQTSLAANKPEMRNIGSSHNVAPTPFGAQPPASVVTQSADGRIKKVVHSQYNSPMGLYSDQQVSQTFQNRVVTAQESDSTPPGFRSVQAPTPGVPGPAKIPQTSMHCGVCGDMIKGVFVKVQNKIPMHPNCLKCHKCGVGLRNIGYFYINEKLYCETHAKQVAQPPGPDMKPVASYQ